MKISLGRSHRK